MSRHTLSRESVFNAMLSLRQKGIAVTRDSLQQVTGEPLGRIREHIDSLIDSGQVERLHRGVYRPIKGHSVPFDFLSPPCPMVQPRSKWATTC